MSEELQGVIGRMREDNVPEVHIKNYARKYYKNAEAKRLASLTPAQLAGEGGINFSKGFTPYNPDDLITSPTKGTKEEHSDLIKTIFKQNEKGGFYHEPRIKLARKIGTKEEELARKVTRNIPIADIKKAIQNNPLFKGATVNEAGIIELSDGKRFNALDIDDVMKFEGYMATRKKDKEATRKDIALGNFSFTSGWEGFDGKEPTGSTMANFNKDPRMNKLGYKLIGSAAIDNGDGTYTPTNSYTLLKDGKAVDIKSHAWMMPELQGQLEDGVKPQDMQSTDPLAPNYFKMDESLIKNYIYKNITEEELQEVESMNAEAFEIYNMKREKALEKSGSAYTDQEILFSYKQSPEFVERFVADAKEGGVSEEGIKIFKNYITAGPGTSSSTTISKAAQDMLKPEDLAKLKAVMYKRKKEKTFEFGLKNHRESMEDAWVANAMTGYLDNEVSDSMRGVFKAGVEGEELLVEKTEEKINIDLQNLEKGAEETKKEIFSMVNSIARDAAKNKIGIDYVNNMYVAVGGSDLDREPILDRLKVLNSKQRRANTDFEKVRDHIMRDHARYIERRRGASQASDLMNREYGDYNLLATKFEDRVNQMLLSVPALAGSTWAVEKKAEIQKTQQETLRLVPDYKTAVAQGQKWEYMLANAGDQAPNILAAIGATVATGGSALASPILFGLDSAASTWVDSDVAQKSAKEAKRRLAELEKNKDGLNYNDYIRSKIQLEKQVMAGDLSQAERYGQAFSAGMIEFGVQYGLTRFGLGTSGWAQKFLSNPASRELGEQVFASNWSRAGGLVGGFVRDQAGELVEEISIDALTTVSNAWWTGQAMDFSNIDDVAVSTLATGGMMAGGNVYTNVANHYASKETRQVANKALNNIENLFERLATIPSDKKHEQERAGIKERIKQEFKVFGDINTEMEIAMLEGGATKLKALAKNALNLRQLNLEAGILPTDTEKQAEKKREDHIKTLSDREADSYENRLKDAREVRDELTEFDYNDVSVEDLYGEQGVMMMEKLKKQKGFPKGKKQQLIKLHQALQKEAVDNKIKQFKKTDAKRGNRAQKFINLTVYGKENYTGKRDMKKENALWSEMAANALAAQDKATTLYDKQTKLSETFLTEKELSELTLVEAKDRKELERAIMRDPNMTKEQKQKNLQLFKEGKINGLISNGQYITLSKVDVNKALKTDGTFTMDDVINQGTVIVHELSHAVDALAMDDTELDNFATLLEKDISERYSAVDNKAKERGIIEGWYDASKDFAEQSLNAKDEYTKAVQEIFAQEVYINDTVKLSKERQSLSNKIRAAFDGDYKFTKPSDATYYIADFLDKFNKGELSQSAKRRIKKRKGKLLPFSPSGQTGTRESARSTRGSDLQGQLDSFKSRNKIEGDILKDSKSEKRKLVAELLQGGEIDLQKSILGQEAGGIIESITRRLYDNIPETELNGVTRKEYKDRLLMDLATMIEKEYSEVTVNKKGVETRNTLDKFASSRLNNRAGTVARDMGIESSVDFGGLGFKVPIDQAKNVIDNYTPTGVFGEVDDEVEEKILSLRRKMKIEKGSDLYNKVLDTVVTATISAGDINTDGFKTRLQNAFADAFVNDIKKLIGTPKSPKYKTFLQDQGPAVYSKLSLETLNQRFQYFTDAVLDPETGKQLRMDVETSEMNLKVKSKTAGNAIFTKKSPTAQVLEDFVNYFVNPQSVTPGKGRADSRRTSLAEAISVELGFDAMMEVLEDPATLDKVKQIAEMRGFEVSDNFLSVLGKVIDRAPGTKFSTRSTASINNLQNFLRQDDNRVLEGVDINPVLDDYVSKLSPEEKKEILPVINKIKALYKEQGKNIDDKTFREAMGKEAATIGQKLGFDFYTGFDSMLEKITDGQIKRIDTTTDDGTREYLRQTGNFSSLFDPEFLNLSMLASTFTGSTGLSNNTTRINSKGKTVAGAFKTKDVQDSYRPNNAKKGEFKGNKKLVTPITTTLEEKILEEVRKLPVNPTPAEVKALSDKINKLLPPAKRVAIEQARDYFYNKINEYINDPSTYPNGKITAIERASRLSYISTLLQAQTSASSGISRQGAVLSSITLDYSQTQKRGRTGKVRPYQSEHNIQLLNFNGNVLKAIVNDNFATAYPIISKKYTQTLLDADAQSVLDSKTGELSQEFIKKYGVRDLSEYIGKTAGTPGFVVGMESEAMFVVALGNANRTLDLRTGLTMDQVIYNKINANRTIDMLDDLANKTKKDMGTSYSSRVVMDNKSSIFNNADNSNLWNSIITKSALGVNPKSDVFLLAQRIENKPAYDGVTRANNTVLLDYGLATKLELRGMTEQEKIDRLKTLDGAVKMSRRSGVNPRGMSTFDFDETAGISDNFVIATKDGETKRISSAEWPVVGDQLVKDGWKMDFSDFNKVTRGRPGPLMQKLKNQIKKYGPDNVFILTARAPESAPAIKAYLESEGVNLPLKNITGLGNSTGEAKAMWMLKKFEEGYNDMYFVDDALANVKAVKNVLNQLDVKSKVVQTKFSGRTGLDFELNQILEDNKGIKNEARYSRALAKVKGKNIGRMQFFLPPSAEDFEGLMYPLLGKGAKGDAQRAWFNKHLFEPFARGNRDINAAKQKVANDYRALKKQNKTARKKLTKTIPGSNFTYDQAVRVYLWNKAGFDIPGLSKRDLDSLLAAVDNNPDIQAFADQLGVISQQEAGYTQPSENWVVETIASDLNNITQNVGRKEFLAEWIRNKNEIFSEENLNKLESIYGTRWREAVEDILYRMENGTNRNFGTGSRIVNQYSNWVNNSVGAIMFFNGRSAVLQTLSTVNFINWSDNNPIKAAAAFANQPQYWKDFVYIFNSDMLRERRAGLKTDVNQAELAAALAGQTNKAKAALNYLLKIGFTPTQIADSFAIAAGGATFYRNRVKSLKKKGMSTVEAEKQAWIDFQVIAEKTQQSSRPDMISQVQASPLGRLILAFQNTPMQYTRLIKKATLDLANRRGDWKTNVSKIIYYGAVQNFIFSSLQSALFATIFGAEEEDEKALDAKKIRIGNSMIDSILRGSGLTGAALSTIKNIIMEFMKQEEKGFKADHTYTVLQAINLSPPIGSKARKLYSGIQTWRYNKDVIKERGLRLDNPVWNGIGNVIDAGTNVPVGRVIQKMNNVKESLDSRNETWQRVALMLGWNTWDLGVENEDLNILREELKKKKKRKKKTKSGTTEYGLPTL